MAGMKAPRGRAHLMRTKKGMGRYLSSGALHTVRVWSNCGTGLEVVQLTGVWETM